MRRPAVALVAGGLLVLAAGVTLALRSPGSGAAATRAAPVADRGVVPASGPAGRTATRPRAGGEPVTLPGGSRLAYPRFSVDAPITAVRAVAGVMQVPRGPHRVGWWRDGAAPGAAGGSVVVVGHVNYAGTDGALSILARARPGDRVEIVEPRTEVRYRVAAVRTYPKERGIPAEAFARYGPPRLVLITCGGPFDAASGNYEDNVVVYAVPA